MLATPCPLPEQSHPLPGLQLPFLCCWFQIYISSPTFSAELHVCVCKGLVAFHLDIPNWNQSISSKSTPSSSTNKWPLTHPFSIPRNAVWALSLPSSISQYNNQNVLTYLSTLTYPRRHTWVQARITFCLESSLDKLSFLIDPSVSPSFLPLILHKITRAIWIKCKSNLTVLSCSEPNC